MTAGEGLVYGVIGGIAGGIAQGMIAMGYTMMARGDVMLPLKEIGAVVMRANWQSGTSAAIGLLVHMMYTALLGAVFGLIVAALGIEGIVALAALGTAVGIADWAVARYAVLPWLDPVLIDVFGTPAGFIAHAAYGMVLGVVFALL